MNPQEPESPAQARIFGRLVRWGSWVVLLLMGLWLWEKIAAINTHRFPWLVWWTVGFTSVYGLWMLLPWGKAKPALWRIGVVGYLIFSVFFVFLMIGNIMVDASAAGAAGERLGVPGIEGAIMFLCLAQIPGFLFERHPEMMV
jgi:hypothetical protein